MSSPAAITSLWWRPGFGESGCGGAARRTPMTGQCRGSTVRSVPKTMPAGHVGSVRTSVAGERSVLMSPPGLEDRTRFHLAGSAAIDRAEASCAAPSLELFCSGRDR